MNDFRNEYITIGMTASLTGRYAVQGTQALAGAQAWVDDTNRVGGIRLARTSAKLPARLISYNDESSPNRCADLTARLIDHDSVDMLIGPYSSGLAIKAAAVAEQRERVLWNQGGASESVNAQGLKWVVSILPPDSRYFEGVIDYFLSRHPSPASVAIVHSTAGVFPKEVAGGAESCCQRQGFTSIKTYQYPARTEDFGGIIEQLKEYRPDLILEVGRIEDDIRFAKQAVESGLNPDAIGLIAAPLVMFGESLAGEAEGFIGPSQWEAGIVDLPDYGPSTEQVLRSFAKQKPVNVDYPMAQAYAGCLIAQRCIEETGTLDNHALREAANRLDFTTFYGRFKIDPAAGRQLGHVMPVIQWQNGKKRIVWPPINQIYTSR